METLRVHLNIHNEIILRCHTCGFAGTALEMLRNESGISWDELPNRIKEAKVFGKDPVPTEWIERAQVWERFAIAFEEAKAWFRNSLRLGTIENLEFGEVGQNSSSQLERLLPGVRLVSRWGKAALFFVELRRSILGLPIQVILRRPKDGRTVTHYNFQPPEPMLLMVPDWALYRDWTKELLVFTDVGMATAMQQKVAEQSSGTEPPIAWVTECHLPLIDELPFRTVRYFPGSHEGGEFALAFA
jgi:hypothetical protein